MLKIKRPVTIALILVVSIAIAFAISSISNCMHKEIPIEECKPIVDKYVEEYNVPAYIVLAVIEVESDFDQFAASDAGALGLMQMTPKTFRWLTSSEHLGENLTTDEIFNVEVSIRYGTYYLRYLFTRFHNWETALAAYNAGEGNVSKWLSDKDYSSDGKTLDEIPFKETRNYIKKTDKAIDYYKNTYYRNEEN